MVFTYISIKAGSKILNCRMGWQLVTCIGEVSRKFKLAELTYSFPVNYMDHILNKSDIGIDGLQLLADFCVLLTAKANETGPRTFHDMAIVWG